MSQESYTSSIAPLHFHGPICHRPVFLIHIIQETMGRRNSFFDGSPAEDEVVAEENTKTLSISHLDLQTLRKASINLDHIYSDLYFNYRRTLLHRLRSLLQESATDRLKRIFTEYPDILQRTRPEHVARYVALSRPQFYRLLKKLK